VRSWGKRDARQGQSYYACARRNCKFQQFEDEFQAESRARAPPPVRHVVPAPAPAPVPAPAPPPVQAKPTPAAPVRAPEPQRTRTRRPRQAQALVGLKNLGNTCYMNACIQCLSHTFELSSVFRRIEDSDLNKTSVVGSKGVLATEFANLIRRVWGSQPNSVQVPSSLKKQIGKLNETFAGFAQQDSQELLRFLLDGLHEDLNRVRQKPKWYELEDIDGESDEAKAARYWQYNIERNSSPVGDLFAGQLMSELVCGHCKRRSTCFDPCWDVSVQLDARASACRLESCLDAFVAPEILKGDDSIYCSRCKKLTPQRKTLCFSRLPRVLVVHLKRFEQVWSPLCLVSSHLSAPGRHYHHRHRLHLHPLHGTSRSDRFICELTCAIHHAFAVDSSPIHALFCVVL
jgi:ubiquitin carboxyl-terminal hydrolase 2/21